MRVNNLGQVAGIGAVEVSPGTFENHIVLWSNGTRTDTGIKRQQSGFSYLDLNHAGQVASTIEAEGERPFVWQAGTITRLPLMAGMLSGSSRVFGINAAGTVVGTLGLPDGPGGRTASVVWQGGSVAEINGRIQGHAGSVVTVNDAGAFLFGQGVPGSRSYLTSGGPPTLVDVPGLDAGGGSTAATDVNQAGQVCGSYTVDAYNENNNRTHAFLWQSGIGVPLPEFASGLGSTAVALNSAGHAVGWAQRAVSDQPAVLWRGVGLTSLNDLPEVQAAGWSGLSVTDINDHDQISGYGWKSGALRAFLISPVVLLAPFSITVVRSGPDLVLSFPSQSGVNYQWQSSVNLEPGSWTNESPLLSGTGALMMKTVSLGSDLRKFFRVSYALASP